MKKIQSQAEFLTFNDGLVDFYKTERAVVKQDTLKSFRFGEETIGLNRFYSARQNDIKLSKVIHIHYAPEIVPEMVAVIADVQYKIEQVQHKRETLPRCTVVSLSTKGRFIKNETD
jgi:SPP1 family predicted phage head-tail adaptor